MTDQERPVEERNELLDDLVSAATAVAVSDEAKQQPAVAQPDAALAAEVASAVDPAEAAEPIAEAPAEAEGASYTPVAEDTSGKPRRVKDLEPGMELEGHVTSIALYGIFVDIGVGRDGLVHISEMSDTRIDSPSDIVQIGDTVKVRVKSVEPDGRRISLTMRSKERANQPRERGRAKKPELNREALSALRVGDNVEGTVTRIAPFGVFVDIGVGKDGLVHVSELAEGRIEKAEDAVTVGQSYTFKVLEVDVEGTRISLSLRRAQRGQRLHQLEIGQILKGTVSGIALFGAFVDIGVGRDGLVHISELSEHRVAKVEDVVEVGDKVTVRVLEIDPGSKRISLSLRLEDRLRNDQGAIEHPSRADLQTSRFSTTSSTAFRDDKFLAQYMRNIFAAISPNQAEVLRRCAIPRWFNSDILGILRTRSEGNEQVLELLQEYSFVRQLDSLRYGYHEEVRRFLLREWQEQRFEEFQLINRHLADYFEQIAN